ncbi:MAG: response regulator transcription factor [Oscillospiraceae bacterium]|nr:response regulator transcription factor [Oscillospiraceae bacterium]
MRILIIEDDREQSRILQFQLEKEGIATDLCYDGKDAEIFLDSNAYEIVLLDRMLPNKDGIEILGDMRRKGNMTPVILLTALGETDDRITGLDSGADDYIVKPYEFKELMAHIRCRLRRPVNIESLDQVSYLDITYKSDENTITGPADTYTLSIKEGQLLDLFLHNPEHVIPRRTILARIWGTDCDIEDGNLDNYIYFIRRRLRKIGSSLCIKTFRGVGYGLVSQK